VFYETIKTPEEKKRHSSFSLQKEFYFPSTNIEHGGGFPGQQDSNLSDSNVGRRAKAENIIQRGIKEKRDIGEEEIQVD
jgi:hypothetical protein